MVFDIIENNFVAVSITLCLILFVLTNNNFDRKTNRLFLAAASCVLILIVTEAWEAQLAVGDTFTPLRTVLSAIGYSLRPLVAYFLAVMVRNYSRARAVLLKIPLVINALVAFSSLFSGVSFSYTADNQFVRGPLGYTPFVVSGIYLFVLLILTVQECRKGGSKEALIVSAIALLAFLSTVLESIFHFQFIQNPCIATSLTYYYLFLHSNQSNRDTLTGALTRRRFYLDARKNPSALSAVISLDLNDLKTLNDKYGHVEGDRALIAVTDTIQAHTGPKASLYRTGGDEFMMLCYRMREEDVRDMIGRIRGGLEKTGYRCAIGYALYDGQMDFDSVCQMADNIMYENKRRMKSGLPELPAEDGGGPKRRKFRESGRKGPQ